jgi:hypothetical protein
MKLLLKSHVEKLRANWGVPGKERKPVVKLFNPCGAATWLISELADDGDSMFGLCDLGMGSPELGYVSLAELSSFRGRFGLGIERDLHFKASKSLVEYAEEAKAAGRLAA